MTTSRPRRAVLLANEDMNLLDLSGPLQALANASRLLLLINAGNRTSAQVKQVAQAHAADLEARIDQMQTMHRALTRLAESCLGDSEWECPILNGLAGRC